MVALLVGGACGETRPAGLALDEEGRGERAPVHIEDVGRLFRGLAACREELTALRACLVSEGLLSLDRFLAQQHRQRFEAAREAHGLTCEADLASCLAQPGIAVLVGLLSGPHALESFTSTSRELRISRAALAEVRSRSSYAIYACGGGELDTPLPSVERYDATSGTWEALPPMREARWSAAAAVVAGELFVCGGGDGTIALSSVERFSPILGSWRSAPPMLVPRYWACAARVAGRLFVCGGEGSDENPLWAAESMDPAFGIWSAEPSLMEPRGGVAGCCLQGVLYVCGGFDEEDRSLRSTERFDAHTVGDWGAAPPMREGRAGAALVAVGRRLIVCGGKAGNGQRLSSVEALDPQVGVWEPLAPMLSARAGGAAASLGTSGLLVFGGFDGTEVLDTVEGAEVPERLAIAAGSNLEWAPVPSMTVRRWGVTAAAVMHR